jgi:hypothetical protein
MSSANTVRKGVVFSIMMAFITVSVQMPVMAGIVDNTQLSAQSELQMQRDELRSILSREDVRTTLLGYGVSNADIDQRINNMTPGELNQIHGQLASLPAGGDAGSAIITILLILILLEVIGAIDIFPRL